MRANQPDPRRLDQRTIELRSNLASRDPGRLALDTGAVFHPNLPGKGYFSLRLWQQEIHISYPDFMAYDDLSGDGLPPFTQAMLMYYFSTADGTPPTGEWISFSQLPDGRFYIQAFQGYTGGELAKAIHSRSEFERASHKLGGVVHQTGSLFSGALAFKFQALPRIPVLVVFWEGDEDFPAVFQVLFDASAAHYLPTDGCALLGSSLTRMLLKAG